MWFDRSWRDGSDRASEFRFMPPGAEGGGRTPARGDRELRRLRRTVELHLPDRRRRPSTSGPPARARRSATSRSTSSERPDDLGVRWLLNVAYMTLGEYPDGVPQRVPDPAGPVPLDGRPSAGSSTWRPRSGLDVRGPNMAGGSVFDDFTGDGLPDVFITSLDADRGASLFVQPGRRHVRGPLASGRPGRSGHVAERQPRRLRQRRRPRRPAPPRAAGKSPCGCRCCATRATGPSRT